MKYYYKNVPIVKVVVTESPPPICNSSTPPPLAAINKHIQHSIEHLLTDLQKREPLDSSYDILLPAPFRKHAKA
eukprot:scaffold10332_cov110-Alexandrium_tamarense.AAC.1